MPMPNSASAANPKPESDCETLYRTLAETAPALLWLTDVNSVTTYFNTTWLEFTGRTLEEELGFGWWNAIHDDDREATFAAFNQHVSQREPFALDYRLKRHDGEYRWLRDTGKPRFTSAGAFVGYVGSCIDISDHKELERALKESESFAHGTVDALTAHIAIIDETGTIIAVNKAWRDFANSNHPVRTNVFEGANYLTVCERTTGSEAAEARAFARGIRAVLSGETSEFSLEYPCHAPWEQRWFNARVTRFETNGRLRVVISHENITKRKLLEDSTAQQNEIIETVNRIGLALGAELELPKLLQTITDAAADVTHAQFGVFFYNLASDDAYPDDRYTTVFTGAPDSSQLAPLRLTPLFNTIMNSAGVVRSNNILRDNRFAASLSAHPLDLPVKSLLAVPMRSRAGDLLGGLFLAHTRPNMFGTRHEQLAFGLASQASIALDNARLYTTERLARQDAERATARVSLLQSITAALSEAVTPSQVAGVIVEQALSALGGQFGVVALLSQDGVWLESASASGEPAHRSTSMVRSSVDASSPLHQAVRLGESVWIEAEGGARQPFPADSDAQPAAHVSSANLPLVANGRVIGGMSIEFPAGTRFSAEDRAFLQALAQQCAQAVQRAQLFTDEQLARHDAEHANALKLKFLAMISHELRTPLTSIKGFATTLLADDVTFSREDQQSFMSIIDEEADKLAELVDQLMDLSRLQAGTLGIRPARQPFSAIVSRAMTQLTTLTPNHQLNVDAPNTLPRVMADAQRIAQVLVNLVSNAVKYAPPSSAITVRARALDDAVQVDVSDQGPGIPPEARDYVFEAFRQVDDYRLWPAKGAGLGLAICQGLVEAHGGTIWIDNTTPSGTTVSFTLPVASAVGGQD